MRPVSVTALKTFTYGDRVVTKGEVFQVAKPIDAIKMARNLQVSVSKPAAARKDLTPDPPAAEPEPEPPSRRRRTYRRRDMQAED